MLSLAAIARIGMALGVAAQLSGCATSTNVSPLVSGLAPRTGPCAVNVIDRGNNAPEGHSPVAKIESHISRNLFFGGRATLLDDAYKELRAKACQLGGDQVRVDDFMETSAAETTHVHVWATVFRRD